MGNRGVRLAQAPYKSVRTVTHLGRVVGFTTRLDSQSGQYLIGYTILSSQSSNPDEDSAWKDFELLTFPKQIRPVGHGVVTVEFKDGPIPWEDVPIQVVSDDQHIYVFRQSRNQSLYVDRFVYDEVLGRLVNTWETRFRRSKKYDIPLDRKDTFGSTDMEGKRFVEPTTDLTFIRNLTGGWFTVAILPTELPGQTRWQIFAYDSLAKTLNSFSIPRSANGWFDLSDSLNETASEVPPDAKFTLQSGDGTALDVATAPMCVLYNRQERLIDDYGRATLQKRAMRLMVALGVGADKKIAVTDFGIGKDGKLAQVGDVLKLAAAPRIGTGLGFASQHGTQVDVPAFSGAPATAMTIEAWVCPRDTSAPGAAIARSATNAALPFTLWLEKGVPTFAVGATPKMVQAPLTLDAEYWTHVAATFDGTDATLYVNGQPYVDEPEEVEPPANPPEAGFRFGGQPGITGVLDEIRLWSVARTRDEVLSSMCTSLNASSPGWASLAGYWQCDEPADDTRFSTVVNSSAVGAAASGALVGATWMRTSAPTAPSMTPFAWDRNGLNASGMLLGFATTAAAPEIVDGGDSTLHLYFTSPADNTFLAAHMSTVNARASYAVDWTAPDPKKPVNDQSGQVVFIARNPGAWCNPVASTPPPITITVDKKGDFCTVVMRSTMGLTETWTKVPRDLLSFVQVINGDAEQTTDDPVAGEEGVVMYDYRSVKVAASGAQKGPQPASGTGSNLFSAMPDIEPDNGMVARVEPTDSDPELPVFLRAGIDCCWLYDPPLAQLSLAQAGQYVAVMDATQMAAYSGELALPGDATIEAWVRPEPFSSGENSTVVVFNKPGATPDPDDGSRYMLAFDPGGRLICAKGSVVSMTRAAIPAGAWTHVAGSYASDYGIQLGGQRYLDAGNATTLSTTDAVTVEAWVRLDKIGPAQAIATKWNESIGRSWSLYVDGGGKLCFAVNQETDTSHNTRTVVSRNALSTGKWQHVAGVYTIEFTKETAIMFDKGSYLKLPQLSNPPADAVTTMMWIKSVGAFKKGIQILIQSVDPRQQVPFLLYLDNGVPTFTAYVGGEEKTRTAPGALRANDWIHIAGRYSDALGVELYVDGQAVGTLHAASAEIRNPASLAPTGFDTAYSVGGMTTQQSFTGMINSLSIWNRGLTVDEIRQRITRPPSASDRGLAGYWPCSDLYGTTVMDLAGTSNGELVSGNFVRVDKGQFAHKVFIDGVLQAFDHVTDPIVPCESAMMIGSGAYADYFQGAIGDIRLWKTGRMNWQIEYFANRRLEPNAEGLISNWTLDTGKGRVAYDAKGDNNALINDAALELSAEAVDKMWIHTTFKAGWTLYIDGSEAPSDRIPLDALGYADAQLTIAATLYRSAFARQFTGTLLDLRVWRQQRNARQLRENMFIQLMGGEPGLVGYWPADDGSGVILADRTGYGADGEWIGNDQPVWQPSLAPIGIELPQVRNALGGPVTPYNVAGPSAPGAQQYGVLETDAYGVAQAVYMRAYMYVAADHSLGLFGNYKVGDLDVQYIGQAQMAPTLIGYIEGAPPVPSENLKVDPGFPTGYNGVSSISVDEMGARTLSYSATRDTGFNMTLNTRLGANFETETEAGLGVSTLLFGFIANIGVQATFDLNLGWLAEAQISNETQITARKVVEVRGAWKVNNYRIDNGVGQMYFPNNMGYALVRSGTADMYALRIQGSGALVSYQLRPNPDIPEDMNIIMFKLRATYVKNGTLDGWIGFQPEESYKNLQPGEYGSYFKPLEAYALKQLIEREHNQLQTYFDNFDAGSIGRRQNVVNFQPGDIGDASNDLGNILMGERKRQAITSEEWRRKMARRNMVNTYVWTSDGGLYAEEEQYTAIREEQSGGSYDFNGLGGFYTEMKFSAGVSFELDALFGGHIMTQATKSKNESESFMLNAQVNGESYVGLIKEGESPEDLIYTDDPSPGKVKGYRFMSFYLAPSKRNFDDFKSVVDEDWLQRQGPYTGTFDPDALALRQSLANVNEVWRVLHRVTYVSRVPPQFKDPGESLPADARKPDAESISNNYWLIQELPAGPPPTVMPAVSDEADKLLIELETNPVWGPLLAKNRAETKQDIMTYMRSYYGVPIN
ncbi:MAG: hypothetical protein JNM76_18155 [Betaproteobacteria bacterium]|nr:hypothetical protein [Betaproteobacteria bacterium]